MRIHLLELEKVNELCTDFSDRYIETLRLKLNNDNIFKCDDDFLNDDGYENLLHDGDNHKEEKKSRKFSSTKTFNKKLKKSNKSLAATSTPIKKEGRSSPVEISGETSLAKIKFNMLNLSASQSLVSNETDLDDDSQHNFDPDDDTYDNFDGVDDLNDESDENEDAFDDNNSLTRSPRSTLKSSSSSCSFINKAGSSSSNADEKCSNRSNKNKRGILPKHATIVMKKWLFQHIVVSFKTNKRE